MAKPKISGATPRFITKNISSDNNDSAKNWNPDKFDLIPEEITPKDAKRLLENSFREHSPDGRMVKFGEEIIEHWEKEEKYDSKQINGRLSKIEMARTAVRNPVEIWDQNSQTAFIQAFRKKTGGKQGVAVFVDKNNVTRTYFPKDVGSLDKVRKGRRIYKKVLQ